jgi:hypothetical protein
MGNGDPNNQPGFFALVPLFLRDFQSTRARRAGDSTTARCKSTWVIGGNQLRFQQVAFVLTFPGIASVEYCLCVGAGPRRLCRTAPTRLFISSSIITGNLAGICGNRRRRSRPRNHHHRSDGKSGKCLRLRRRFVSSSLSDETASRDRDYCKNCPDRSKAPMSGPGGHFWTSMDAIGKSALPL